MRNALSPSQTLSYKPGSPHSGIQLQSSMHFTPISV